MINSYASVVVIISDILPSSKIILFTSELFVSIKLVSSLAFNILETSSVFLVSHKSIAIPAFLTGVLARNVAKNNGGSSFTILSARYSLAPKNIKSSLFVGCKFTPLIHPDSCLISFFSDTLGLNFGTENSRLFVFVQFSYAVDILSIIYCCVVSFPFR